MKHYILALILWAGFVPGAMKAAEIESLQHIASKLDAQLFDQAFNNCKTEVLKDIVADDLEFYHDKGGKMQGKQAYIRSIESGICQLSYKAIRQLKPEGLSVYPLRNGDDLYGMIVQGRHGFYAQYANSAAPEHTGDARFLIFWALENDKWLMKRVFSYDH